MNEIARRAYPANFVTREENGEGIIEGTAVVLNSRTNMGDWDEIIDLNALNETDLTDVRLCMNHDTDYVYARSRRNNGNSTMQLFKELTSLRFRAGINISSSPKAQDFYSAVNRRDMDKMSFMFTIEAYQWEDLDTNHPTRRITKIGTVYEISLVTFPAYQDTSIEARDASALESVKRELESLRAQRLKTLDSDKLLDLAKARYEYNKKFL